MGEIHVYTGGTAGNRDGTLVSDDGSNSNPLNFGSLVVGQESGWIPFAYRSALGRKTQVPPVFKGDIHLKYSKDGGTTSPGYGADLTDDSALGDTNRIAHVKCKVLAGETGVLHPKIIIDAVQSMIDIPPTPTLSVPSITATSPQAKVVRIGLTAAVSNVGATITYDVYIGGVLKDSGISAFATKDYTVNAGTYSVYVVAKDTANSLSQNSNTVTGLVVAAPTLSTPSISANSPTYNSITATLNTQATSNAGVTPVYDVYIDGALTESNLAASALTGGKSYGSIAPGTHSVMVRAKDTTNGVTADSNTVTGISVANPPANQAPVASSVSISGTATLGSTLTGNYTYSDNESNPEGTSTFRWLRNGVAIAGATAKTYTIVSADIGTTLTFEVTPVASAGTTTGTPATATKAIPADQVPVINGLSATANATTLTTKATSITDAESEAITEIDVVYSTTGTDNPDTLFAGTNKAVYTAGADITAFTGAGKTITGTFTVAQTVFVWARAKDASGMGTWVQTTAMPLDANTLAADGFEGTIVSGNIDQSGTGSVAFSAANPITGLKSLVCDKDAAANKAGYKVAFPSVSENFIRASVKFRIDRLPSAGGWAPNIAGIGKDWDLPFFTVYNSVAGVNAIQIGLSHDGYLIYNTAACDTLWEYYVTPLVVGTAYTLEITYNRSTKALQVKLNGNILASRTANYATTDNTQFNTIMLHYNSTGGYDGKITYDEFLMKKV